MASISDDSAETDSLFPIDNIVDNDKGNNVDKVVRLKRKQSSGTPESKKARLASFHGDEFILSSHDEENQDHNDLASDRIDSDPVDLAAGTKHINPGEAQRSEGDSDHTADRPDLHRILEDETTESGYFPVNSIVNCESFCPSEDDGEALNDSTTSILQTNVELSTKDDVSRADSDAGTNGCSNSTASSLEAAKTVIVDGPRLNLREEPEINAPTLTSNAPTNRNQDDLEFDTIVESRSDLDISTSTSSDSSSDYHLYGINDDSEFLSDLLSSSPLGSIGSPFGSSLGSSGSTIYYSSSTDLEEDTDSDDAIVPPMRFIRARRRLTFHDSDSAEE